MALGLAVAGFFMPCLLVQFGQVQGDIRPAIRVAAQ